MVTILLISVATTLLISVATTLFIGLLMEKRCDLHGPWTPEQAALLVTGRVPFPEPTGYLCQECENMVKVMVKDLADTIVQQALDHFDQTHGVENGSK